MTEPSSCDPKTDLIHTGLHCLSGLSRQNKKIIFLHPSLNVHIFSIRNWGISIFRGLSGWGLSLLSKWYPPCGLYWINLLTVHFLQVSMSFHKNSWYPWKITFNWFYSQQAPLYIQGVSLQLKRWSLLFGHSFISSSASVHSHKYIGHFHIKSQAWSERSFLHYFPSQSVKLAPVSTAKLTVSPQPPSQHFHRSFLKGEREESNSDTFKSYRGKITY